jgi:ribose 5-phosphate isomerase A
MANEPRREVECFSGRGGMVHVEAERMDEPLILDCAFGPIERPGDLAALLEARAGIVEHGLFIYIATDVLVGTADGVRHLSRNDRAVQR